MYCGVMVRLTPRIARYAIGTVVLLWVVIAELSVLAFGYGLLAFLTPWLPPLRLASVAAVVTSLPFFAVTVVAFVGTAVLGRIRYGSLAAFAIAVLKRLDDLLSHSLFDEPVVTGRLRHDGVAWRLHYRNDDRTKVEYRECPFCGLELSESFLPRHVVNEPNTAFNSGEKPRETDAEEWHDVFGKEKAEDRDETLALTCPQCNFSVPGEKGVKTGRDGARAKFQQHVERMKTENPRSDPFAEYAHSIRDRTGNDPTPEGIWDEYATNHPSDDLLRVGIDPSFETGSAAEQSRPGTNRAAGGDRVEHSPNRSEEVSNS